MKRDLRAGWRRGLYFEEYDGRQLRFHTGATGAWKAVTYRFPDQSVSIVTLTNSGKISPRYQTNRITKVLLGDNSLKIDFATTPFRSDTRVSPTEISGVYTDEGGFMFSLKIEGKGVLLERFGRKDIRLTRESPNVFAQTDDRAFKLEFRKNKNEQMTVTAYYTSHAPYTLTRNKSALNETEKSELVGTFLNTETGAVIRVSRDSPAGFSVFDGKRKRKAYWAGDSKVVMQGYLIQVV